MPSAISLSICKSQETKQEYENKFHQFYKRFISSFFLFLLLSHLEYKILCYKIYKGKFFDT